MKKCSNCSLKKKGLQIYLSSIKTKAAIKFKKKKKKKKKLYLAENWPGRERVSEVVCWINKGLHICLCTTKRNNLIIKQKKRGNKQKNWQKRITNILSSLPTKGKIRDFLSN